MSGKVTDNETQLQKVWSAITFFLPPSRYREFGATFTKFEFEGKRYKIEVKEIK